MPAQAGKRALQLLAASSRIYACIFWFSWMYFFNAAAGLSPLSCGLKSSYWSHQSEEWFQNGFSFVGGQSFSLPANFLSRRREDAPGMPVSERSPVSSFDQYSRASASVPVWFHGPWTWW